MTDEQRALYESLLLLALDDERLRGSWIAMDSDGRFYTFTTKPHISRNDQTVWIQNEDESEGDSEYYKKASTKFNLFIVKCFGEMYGIIPWEETLVKIN